MVVWFRFDFRVTGMIGVRLGKGRIASAHYYHGNLQWTEGCGVYTESVLMKVIMIMVKFQKWRVKLTSSTSIFQLSS